MAPTASIDWSRLEEITHGDPGGRGLAAFRRDGKFLDAGQIEPAARSLASAEGGVAIVTGFCVADLPRPVAETDGPPGALFLARATSALGRPVMLISDAVGVPILTAGCRHFGLPTTIVREFPFESADPNSPERLLNDAAHSRCADAWIDAFFRDRSFRCSHLIAIERVGPSHTLESLAAQQRQGVVPLAEFEREVPADGRDVCQTMRGTSIQGHTAKTHRLFEAVGQRKLPITTIGLADGGNEIGLGCLPWEVLREAIRSPGGPRIACRVATDYLLLAGVSDWAAYALAAAACALAGRAELLTPWDAATQQRLINTLVAETGAVDGVTKRSEATVDGLAPDDYLQVLTGIRTLLGISG